MSFGTRTSEALSVPRGSESFFRDVSKRDAGLLVHWWNAYDQRHRYHRRRDGMVVLKHGLRHQLWNVYRDEIEERVRRNSDERLRSLERRWIETPGDAGALHAYMNELRRNGDQRWIALWLAERVPCEGHVELDDIRAIVGAVAKGEMPWAWLYAQPPEPDEKREKEEELEWMVDMALVKAEDIQPRSPSGSHDRWIFALAVRRPDGSVALGVRESPVATFNAAKRSVSPLARTRRA